MATIGCILLCPHYPAQRPEPRALDPRLRRMLAAQGLDVRDLRIFRAHDGQVPDHPGDCHGWIVSGPAALWSGAPADQGLRVAAFLRAAVAGRHPLLALYHAEAVVHAALTGLDDAAARRAVFPLSLRNPLARFQGRDRLYRWDGRAGGLVDVTGPAAPRLRVRVGALLRRLAG